jgi:hypothetical protein
MDNPVIDKYGNKFWYDTDGVRHRTDGPAIEWLDGDKFWYQHGECHRDDGPAYESANGGKSWYLHDQCLTFDEWLNKVDMSDEDKVMLKLEYG